MRINPLMARLRSYVSAPFRRAQESAGAPLSLWCSRFWECWRLLDSLCSRSPRRRIRGRNLFRRAAKNNAPTSPDADMFFNDVLRQVIVGPSISEKQSALWGGKKSLLPTMFGRDLSPFSGQGVNVIWNGGASTSRPSTRTITAFPTTESGTPQPNDAALLQLNLSPAAQGSLLDLDDFPRGGNLCFPIRTPTRLIPISTVLFCPMTRMVPNTITPTVPTRVIIPSFHRPQYLRNATGSLVNPVPVANWYIDPNTAKLVLYPHVEHLAINNSGVITTTQRFVTGTHPDTTTPGSQSVSNSRRHSERDPHAAVWRSASCAGRCLDARCGVGRNNRLPAQCPGRPCSLDRPSFHGHDSRREFHSQPVWPVNPTLGVTTVNDGSVVLDLSGPTIFYAVDTDNDGVPDANYMDFGFPLMTTPDGTQQFVAMAAVRIIDAEGLYNLNVHGNRGGQAAVPSANNFGGLNTFLSHRTMNEPSEVIGGMGLDADSRRIPNAPLTGTIASTLLQYTYRSSAHRRTAGQSTDE